MHSSIKSTHSPLRSWLALLALAVLFAATASAQAQTVYTVGNTSSDPDCDYLVLRQALDAAATQVGGTAVIRITAGTDISLGYSWVNTNNAFTLSNPQTDISITGGYASCSATSPMVGEFTRLTYTSNVDTDADHTMLAISNAISNPRHYLGLINIRLEGASDANKGAATIGGGLKVTGNVHAFLQNSRVSGFNATLGGGVALIGSGTDPGWYPKLYMIQNSFVRSNTAGSGGGIYSLFGRVMIEGSTVIGNSTRLHGGGIYLVDHEDAGDASSNDHFALLLGGGLGRSIISGNSAGTGSFSTASGLGGGIYSKYGQIRFGHNNFGALTRSKISANSANLGGGIYIEGPDEDPGGPFTDMILSSTTFDFNTSRGQGGALYMRNAVAGQIYGYGAECQLGYGTPHPGPCMYFYANKALGNEGGGAIARGGAIYLHNSRTDGASRPALQVFRTWFDDNADAHGLAAVAAADGAGDISFSRSIFTNNDAKNYDRANSALIYTHTGKGLNFRYNTVLDSNTSTRMFSINGGTLDVTGSILWGTVDRSQRFHFVWFEAGGANMVHTNCLLVRDSDSGTAGVPNPSFLWAGHAPDLDERFAPRGNSAAIDHCDVTGGTPPPDAYVKGVYDVPGVSSRYGSYDLGAVEQDDVIFANSFGVRPYN